MYFTSLPDVKRSSLSRTQTLNELVVDELGQKRYIFNSYNELIEQVRGLDRKSVV